MPRFVTQNFGLPIGRPCDVDVCPRHGAQPRRDDAPCPECEDERLALLRLQVGPARFNEEMMSGEDDLELRA